MCCGKYATICQSSGYGKTRTIFELKDNILTIYFCLRWDNQSGIPRRNAAADKLPQCMRLAAKFGNPDAVYECFFDLVIGKVVKMFDEWEFNNNNNKALYQKVFQVTSTEEESTSSFWSSIGATLKIHCADQQAKHLDKHHWWESPPQFEFKQEKAVLPEKLDIILFAFDEAREMLNIKHNIDVQAERDKRIVEERTMFECVRSYFKVESKPFAIFVDTSTRIWNFNPRRLLEQHDASRRGTDGTSLRLLPCFHWVPSIGLVTLPADFNHETMWLEVSPPPPPQEEMAVADSKTGRRSERKAESLKTIVLRVNIFFLAHLSRAMFADMISFQSHHIDRWLTIVQLAREKLFSVHYGNVQLRNKQICMAVRFMLLPATLNSSARETLVGWHMATLLQHDGDISTTNNDDGGGSRTVLDIAYVPEPVLAVAACAQMISSRLPLRDYLDLVVHKRNATELGVLYSQGDAEEFAAAVVLSQCFDLVVKRNFLLQDRYHQQRLLKGQEQQPEYFSVQLYKFAALPISAVDYFAMLFGEIDNPDQLRRLRQKYPLLDNYFMGFTQFIKTNRPISQALLLDAFHRRVAFVCRQNEVAIDIVIPMARCNGDVALMLPSAFEKENGGVAACPLTPRTVKEDDMTAIICQVKNCHRTTISKTLRNAMFSEMEENTAKTITAEHLSISILFNVGDACADNDRRKDSTLVESNNAENIRIYIPVLSQKFLPFLEKADVDVLRKLVAPLTKKYCDAVEEVCACNDSTAWKLYNNTIPLALSLPPGVDEEREENKDDDYDVVVEDKQEELPTPKRRRGSPSKKKNLKK
eukprot:scaffold4392_cov187-Ochromonas_danica.AAC.10